MINQVQVVTIAALAVFAALMVFVGILTYMVGLRDKAEAEAFENEQNKIKIEEVLK